MRNCTEWRDRIDAYVDAELPPSEMVAFRAHIGNALTVLPVR